MGEEQDMGVAPSGPGHHPFGPQPATPSSQSGVPNADDYDFDYEDNECFNCGGEGYVASCFSEYACMYPDEGCDLCTRRCDVCRPRKPNPHPGNTGKAVAS